MKQTTLKEPESSDFGSQRVKKVCDFFARFKKRHIFCENKFSRKISLRSSKSLINQAFLMAINPISSGAFAPSSSPAALLSFFCSIVFRQPESSLSAAFLLTFVLFHINAAVGLKPTAPHMQACRPYRLYFTRAFKLKQAHFLVNSGCITCQASVRTEDSVARHYY